MSKHTRGSTLERRKRQERHRRRCASAPIRRIMKRAADWPHQRLGTFASVESAVCSIPGVDKKPRLSEESGFVLVIRLGSRRSPAPRELVPVVREACRYCVPLGIACRVETGRRVRRERRPLLTAESVRKLADAMSEYRSDDAERMGRER